MVGSMYYPEGLKLTLDCANSFDSLCEWISAEVFLASWPIITLADTDSTPR